MGINLIFLSLTFVAGCIGGLVNSLAVWSMGKVGITKAMGVSMAPDWSPAWLYPRLVWGGLWGFLFLIPNLPESILLRGLLVSLGPTFVVLAIVFPIQAKKGFLGLQLGAMTPIFAFFVNAVWGICAAWWLTLL
ncbi:MAG: hypothetical protein ACI9CF_001428 [Candidatus Omnitrophota bacterium]|jgi:hypothetical protein